MKNYIINLLLFVPLFFAGCEKDEAAPSGNIKGSWKLTATVGGMVPSTIVRDVVINFSDGTYQVLVDGAASDNGNYVIESANIKLNNEKVKFKLTMSSTITSAVTVTYYNLSKNVLKIYVGEIAADGTVSTYKKM